jgi:hypothetical protein
VTEGNPYRVELVLKNLYVAVGSLESGVIALEKPIPSPEE